MSTAVIVNTKTCFNCGKQGSVVVSGEGYLKWTAGAFVQEAFPELDKEMREQLISGTHPTCWVAMFGEGHE